MYSFTKITPVLTDNPHHIKTRTHTPAHAAKAQPLHHAPEVSSIDHIDPEVTHWKPFCWSAGMDAVPRGQPWMCLYLRFRECWLKQRTRVDIRWILWITCAVKEDITTHLLRDGLLWISHLSGEVKKKIRKSYILTSLGSVVWNDWGFNMGLSSAGIGKMIYNRRPLVVFLREDSFIQHWWGQESGGVIHSELNIHLGK